MKTYNDICISVRKQLKAAGIEAFGPEARLLVAGACGKTVEELIRDYGLYVGDEFTNKVQEMVDRRLEGEPVAYITGAWEFYGIVFNVNEDVLVPRIDTEVLVDAAIKKLKIRESKRTLDLCCGSGCIGIAIASNVPSSRVIMIDKSLKALSVCRSNVNKCNVARSVTCIDCDVKEAPPMLLGMFDMIVSNPPYIPTDDIDRLDVSVREFEPMMALDGGDDGLDFYRSILGKWKAVLKKDGYMLLECGINQAEAVTAMMVKNGFTDIEIFKDTLNVDRVVSGKYTGGE